MDIADLHLSVVAMAIGALLAVAIAALRFAPQVLDLVMPSTVASPAPALSRGRIALLLAVALPLAGVMAFTEATVIALVGVGGVTGGVATGLHLWLGVALPATVFTSLSAGKGIVATALTAGHYLVILVATGTIIGALS